MDEEEKKSGMNHCKLPKELIEDGRVLVKYLREKAQAPVHSNRMKVIIMGSKQKSLLFQFFSNVNSYLSRGGGGGGGGGTKTSDLLSNIW